MRNIIRIGAGTDGRNRFVAIALGVALAVGPAAMMPAAALAAPATDAAAASTTAGTTITLQGADGASLAGHTFDVYRIGTYTDQILNGTRISSLGVRGDTASNAWAADAIGIANAYDPSTADDIGKVYGYDDAGNIANIKMDSQTRQLRNISKALSQSSKKPAAIQGGANLTTTRSTLTINVPAEGRTGQEAGCRCDEQWSGLHRIGHHRNRHAGGDHDHRRCWLRARACTFRQACRWMACSRGLILTAPNVFCPPSTRNRGEAGKTVFPHTEAKR